MVAGELVKEMDKTRDELVCELISGPQAIQAEIATFKKRVFDDVGAFVELSAEEYAVQVGSRKGNLTLCTFDSEYKMQVAVQHLNFDERIHAAKEL